MKTKLSLFSAYGVEIEYMIVRQSDLSVLPVSDKLIFDVEGRFQNEVKFEHIAWSNELVLHVLELKTNGPVSCLMPLSSHFQEEINRINQLLEKYQAKLLPTGAHPWMNPFTEASLWPHDNKIIYETYNKIFDCRGHGWNNLQCVHLNLPFKNDIEFAKLHTAIRLVLPLIPSLCASTPILDGKKTGFLDTRLEFYRFNQKKIPSITGNVIPELVLTEEEYHDEILNKMYQEISPYDHEKHLQEEWLNSRGAIARFDRNTIEIRLIDTQECPTADIAILTVFVAILKKLVAEEWIDYEKQKTWTTQSLQAILIDSIKNGMNTMVECDYAEVFGCKVEKPISLQALWGYLVKDVSENLNESAKEVMNSILVQGNLAQRILAAFDQGKTLVEIYQQLSVCLQKGKLFLNEEVARGLQFSTGVNAEI